MANSYSVSAVLSAKDRGFTSTLKSALGTTESLGSKLKGGLGFGVLAGVGQQAFASISSGVKSLFGEINQSNAAWKTFASNMQIIGKGKNEINGVKKELQAFAEQTVYGASDMAQTYAQLAAVGTKNTTKLVKGFGGLAAAAENPQQAMKTLSQQATQMAAKPTVAWQDFKLMLEQSPAGMAAVAKQMGMTTSELVTKIQDGKVKTDAFFDAITEVGNSDGFAKMATEAKTMGQAFQGIKEALGNKLMPSFDVLSKKGISILDKFGEKISGIDADALAKKVQGAMDVITTAFAIVKDTFGPVVSAFKDAFSAIGEALGVTKLEFSKTGALSTFRDVCETVAGALEKVAGFLEEHADIIAKVLPYVGALAGAFIAFKVLNTVAPGLMSFAGGLVKMAGKGIAGLAAKLFGIAGGQKAVGTASQSSAPSILQAALACLALGGAVLLAGAGIWIIANAAISLAEAGWPAIGVMVGLIAVIALLAIGAAALGPALTAGAVGFLAFGAAILMVGAGFALISVGVAVLCSQFPIMVQYGTQAMVAFIQLGIGLGVFAAGALAAGVAGLVLAAALLIVSVAVLTIATGFLLIASGCLIAAGAVALLALVLPTLAAQGAAGAEGLAILSLGLIAFGAAAGIAGVGALALGVGLTAISIAVLTIATAFLVVATAALVAAAALALIAVVMPLLGQHGAAAGEGLAAICPGLVKFGLSAALAAPGILVLSVAVLALGVAITALGAGLVSMAIGGAAAAGAIALLNLVLPQLIAMGGTMLGPMAELAASLALFGAGALVAGTGALVLGAGLLAVGVGGIAAAGAFALLNLVLPAFIAIAAQAGMAMLQITPGLLAFGVGTAVAGAGALLLGVALLTVAAALTLLGVGLSLVSVAMLGMTTALLALTMIGGDGAVALLMLSGALAVFSAAAILAGAGAVVLGVGLVVVGAALIVLGAAALVASVGVMAVSAASILLAAGLSLVLASLLILGSAFPLVAAGALFAGASFALLMVSTVAATALVLVFTAALVVMSAGVAVGALAISAFGVSMLAASVGTLAMAGAVKAINSSMKSIAKNAKSAAKSLDGMQDSVNIVESGLSALGSKAKSAMKQLTSAFDDSAGKAQTSGRKVSQGFTQGLQAGLMMAPPVALSATLMVNNALLAGRSRAYMAGMYIGLGFAQGMQSMLGQIRSAGDQMAQAAQNALEAKAKISSPSKISDKDGQWWGQGYVNGILAKIRDVRKASKKLVSIPSLATPDLALAYGGELSADYDYFRSNEYTIEVPLAVDGREFAKATAKYSAEEMDKNSKRESRKRGRT